MLNLRIIVKGDSYISVQWEGVTQAWKCLPSSEDCSFQTRGGANAMCIHRVILARPLVRNGPSNNLRRLQPRLAIPARDRHGLTMPLSDEGTTWWTAQIRRSSPRAGQLRHRATPRRRTALTAVARPAAEIAALLVEVLGSPRTQAAARPGPIAGTLAGRSTPTCLGWRRGGHSAGHGGEAR